jgi:hypothetical protein
MCVSKTFTIDRTTDEISEVGICPFARSTIYPRAACLVNPLVLQTIETFSQSCHTLNQVFAHGRIWSSVSQTYSPLWDCRLAERAWKNLQQRAQDRVVLRWTAKSANMNPFFKNNLIWNQDELAVLSADARRPDLQEVCWQQRQEKSSFELDIFIWTVTCQD